MRRPTPLLLVGYRLLGWRLGPAYKDWVLDDLTRRGWLVRAGGPVLATAYGVGVLLDVLLGGDPGKLLALVVVLAGGGAFLRHALQERALRRQGLAVDGTPVAPWYDDDRARRRHNLLGAVATVVLVLAALDLLALRSR